MIEDNREKWRANFVPAPQFFNLNQACAVVNRAYPEGQCYLVGSSLRRRDFRDVDVRMMLPDEAYDRLFRDEHGWLNALWSLTCTSVSLWLSQQSVLPIDFQIQRQSKANEQHAGERSALGLFVDCPGDRPSDNGGAP